MPLIPYQYQFKMCSEAFHNSVETLDHQGVPYYGDMTVEAAKKAIDNFVPDMLRINGEELYVEALDGVATDEDESTRQFRDLGARAFFSRVDIKEVREAVDDDGIAVELARRDLYAVFKQEFTDPDPVDLVLYNELYIPFSSFEAIELVDK